MRGEEDRMQKRRDKREGGKESFIFTISTTSDAIMHTYLLHDRACYRRNTPLQIAIYSKQNNNNIDTYTFIHVIEHK